MIRRALFPEKKFIKRRGAVSTTGVSSKAPELSSPAAHLQQG
jgi:hypothetical protein